MKVTYHNMCKPRVVHHLKIKDLINKYFTEYVCEKIE